MRCPDSFINVHIYESGWAWIFINCSGWHSGQGSIFPGITKEIRLWLNTSGERARLFAQNFGARLAGIVIWSDCPLFQKMSRGAQIDKKWLNWQYTCSKPGAAFSEVAEAPQAITTSHSGLVCAHVCPFICPYMSVHVHICPYMFQYVRICPYILRGYVSTWIFINLGTAWVFF